MIKKEYKLKTKDVKTVSKAGTLYKSGYFEIRCLNSYEFNVGVAISKKIHKSSVVRNRIKRKIYDSFRDLYNDGVLSNNKYFVIVRSIEIDNLTNLKEEITKTLKD